MTRANRILHLIAEEDTSYYVVADPREADKIKATKKDDKAAFKGSVDDAKKYVKDKMKGKDAVLMKRTPSGDYEYVVGEDYDSSNDVENATDFEKMLMDTLAGELGVGKVSSFGESGIDGKGVIVVIGNKEYQLAITQHSHHS